MMEHDWMFIRATPYRENPLDASFDISGLKHVITPLGEACNRDV